MGTGLASAYFARQAGEAAAGVASSVDPTVALTLLQDCLHIQVTYGAVLLSFTGKCRLGYLVLRNIQYFSGALHWGMEMAGYNGFKGYPRVLLGALPVIYGWSTLALDPMYALMAQWAGFTGMWYVDMKATSAAWSKYLSRNGSKPNIPVTPQLQSGIRNTGSICPFWSAHGELDACLIRRKCCDWLSFSQV